MRNWYETNLHDRAIEFLATNLVAPRVAGIVVTNPNQQKNIGIEDRTSRLVQYPDIVVCDHRRELVSEILEVETEDSVTTREAGQWLAYSRLGCPFYLCVPRSRFTLAQQILAMAGIPIAGLFWWDFDTRAGWSFGR